MAITINSYRSLTGSDYLLQSAFNRQTIGFNVAWGGATKTAVTIDATINGTAYSFTPIKTVTGATDTFAFDFTDILRYVLGFPPLTETVTGLTVSFTYAIVIAGSAVTAGETVELCFAVSQIGDISLPYIYEAGRTETVHHNGKISFYYSGTGGVETLYIGGVSHNYTLTHGYNIVTLDATQKIDGTLTSSGTDLSLPLKYSPNTGSAIAWMNKDGAWSFWNFRKLSDGLTVKDSNEIPLYYDTHVDTKAMSRMGSKESESSVSFDTIAMSEAHYLQLVQIANSPIIIYDGRPWILSSASQTAAATKQNLNFQLTLKAQQNAVTY